MKFVSQFRVSFSIIIWIRFLWKIAIWLAFFTMFEILCEMWKSFVGSGIMCLCCWWTHATYVVVFQNGQCGFVAITKSVLGACSFLVIKFNRFPATQKTGICGWNCYFFRLENYKINLQETKWNVSSQILCLFRVIVKATTC